MTALESGTLIVPNSDTDRARAREAEVKAKRQEQIEQDRKLNTLLQAQQARAHVQAPIAPPPGETPSSIL